MLDLANFLKNDQEGIISLVKKPDCTLVQLLQESSIISAVRYEITEVVQFLFDHLDELIDLAVQESSESKISRSVLFDLAYQYAVNISESSAFHKKMNTLLALKNIPRPTIICLSRIILTLGKSENYSILTNLSENQFFFPKFCALIEFNSVYETLLTLATNDHHSIITFFEDLNAALVIFNLAEQSQPSSQCKYFLILAEIISKADKDSSLIHSIKDSAHIPTIFEFCIHGQTSQVQYAAFSLFINICIKNSQEPDSYSSEDEVIVSNAGIDFALEHIEDVCKYVSMMQVFEPCTEKAIELLILLLKTKKEITEPFIYESVNHLLDKFFDNHYQSKLHISCLNLVTAVCLTSSSVSNLNLKKRLKDAYQTIHYDHTSSFWGFIFRFAEIILDLDENDDDEDEQWNSFVEEYTVYKHIINNNYGGDLPQDSYSTSHSEYMIKHLEEIDELDQDEEVHRDDIDTDDIGTGFYSSDLKDDFNQLELDLKKDAEFDDFIIAKPTENYQAVWAKELLADLNNDAFGEGEIDECQIDKDANWTNQLLNELKEDEEKDNQRNSFDIDDIIRSDPDNIGKELGIDDIEMPDEDEEIVINDFHENDDFHEESNPE